MPHAGSGPTAVTGQTAAEYQRLLLYINEAWLEAENARTDWRFMRGRPLALRSMQYAYSPTTDFGLTDFAYWALDYQQNDTFRNYVTASGLSSEIFMGPGITTGGAMRTCSAPAHVPHAPLGVAVAPDNTLVCGSHPGAPATPWWATTTRSRRRWSHPNGHAESAVAVPLGHHLRGDEAVRDQRVGARGLTRRSRLAAHDAPDHPDADAAHDAAGGAGLKRPAFPQVRPDYYPMGGGLDLVTPAITKSPGAPASTPQNYEPAPVQGHRRIDGYERFDGRTQPHTASYWTLSQHHRHAGRRQHADRLRRPRPARSS